MKSSSKPFIENQLKYFFRFTAILLIVGLIIRLTFGEGLWLADDFAHVRAALDVIDEGWNQYFFSISNIYENRISIVLPVALFLKIFGSHELTVSILPLLLSLGTIICTFFIGGLAYNYRLGFIAALIVTFIPQEIWYSTTVLPDSFIPCYTGLSILFLLAGLKYKKKYYDVILYFLSGFSVFLSFQARATSGVIIIPMFLIALLLDRHNWKALFLPTGIFVGILLTFWGILYILTDDFLLQYKILKYDATGTVWTGTGKPFQHLFNTAPLLKLLIRFDQFITQEELFSYYSIRRFIINEDVSLLYYLAFPSMLYNLYMIKKEKCAVLFLLYFGLLYIFFEFGSTSLTSYKQIWKFTRFLTILSIPAALMIAFFFENVMLIGNVRRFSKISYRLFSAILALHVLITVGVLIRTSLVTTRQIDTYRETFIEIRQVGTIKKIYTIHRRWNLRGSVYLRFEPKMRVEFKDLRNTSLNSIRESIVIIDTSFFREYGEYKLSWADFDPSLRNLPTEKPSNWKLLFTKYRPVRFKYKFKNAKPDPVYVFHAH